MKETIRTLATSAILVGVLLSPGQAAEQLVTGEEFADTCSYFENRAKAYRGSEDWLLTLSSGCSGALARLEQSDTPTDAELLHRLAQLRSVIIDMNVTRFTTKRQRGVGSRAIRKSVTASGEYLIARYLGVMQAHRDWVEAVAIETAGLPKAEEVQ